MPVAPPLRRRRAIVLCVSLAVPVALVLGFGHRGVHMVRSMLVPGAGLVGAHNVAAAVCLVAAIAATVAWLRWGLDWLLATVVIVAVVASGLVPDAPHVATDATSRPVMAAHEFPLVLLAAGLISWLRGVMGRVPGFSHLARRRARTSNGLASIDRLSATDRSRTAAVLALSGDVTSAVGIATDPGVERRARRVGAWARGRSGSQPFRVDHAHARAALALSGSVDDAFVRDAGRAALGVPCSEPTWVRPVDATLAAVALQRAGADTSRFQAALTDEFGLRRGHRPAWHWTPLGWSAGSAPAWEHAVLSALARSLHWVGDDDWTALRARALGASARGTEHPHDERLIAAARIWLVFVDDPRATPLLARPTVRHDPLAVALDRLAARLADDPHALIAPHPEVLA